MIQKLRRISLALTGLAMLFPAVAAAHVVVTPNQAAPGERQLFSVSVPNEKTTDVTGLKLEVSAGVDDVMPTVKPGWEVAIEKSDDGKQVTALSWSGGAIPPEQRDDFTFKAQMPANGSQIIWKAYQTYADGTTVAWDQKPSGEHAAEGGDTGPYSVTQLTEAAASDAHDESQSKDEASNNIVPLVISVVALVVAVAAMLRPARK